MRPPPAYMDRRPPSPGQRFRLPGIKTKKTHSILDSRLPVLGKDAETGKSKRFAATHWQKKECAYVGIPRRVSQPESAQREMWEKDIGNITAAGSPVKKTIVAAAGRRASKGAADHDAGTLGLERVVPALLASLNKCDALLHSNDAIFRLGRRRHGIDVQKIWINQFYYSPGAGGRAGQTKQIYVRVMRRSNIALHYSGPGSARDRLELHPTGFSWDLDSQKHMALSRWFDDVRESLHRVPNILAMARKKPYGSSLSRSIFQLKNANRTGATPGDVISDVEWLQPERCSGQAKAKNARIARARSRWYCLMQRLMLMRPVETGYRVHAVIDRVIADQITPSPSAALGDDVGIQIRARRNRIKTRVRARKVGSEVGCRVECARHGGGNCLSGSCAL
ncbi:hypothetical protein DFH08DRAFT_942270 [Mycena albidolilacea]|uniref:Uncharacterized protein n=1 Tax=Mycena albidolilacea TaxID=1033008 RepID=A0AAD6ZF42_9AGAR|nr:hypothetical protein DFH08DRAFT_942270 [Mycena albidolilacea]